MSAWVKVLLGMMLAALGVIFILGASSSSDVGEPPPPPPYVDPATGILDKSKVPEHLLRYFPDVPTDPPPGA